MEQEQREAFTNLLNKRIVITKKVNGKDYIYKGFITGLTEDGIIFDDRKLGKIPISANELSILEVSQ